MSRRPLAVGLLVGVLCAMGVSRGQEPVAVNQSATVEAPSASEPISNEPTLSRPRKATRKLGVETVTHSPGESVPWYRTGLGAMTIVLALLGVLYWGARRWVPSVKTASNAAMTVVARSAVTPKHSLATVQWGRRFVLVGVSNDRMDTLAEVSEPTEAAELAGTLGVRWPAGTSSFDETLMTESSAFDEPTESNPGPSSKPTAVQDLLKRLKTLRSA